MPDIEKVMNGLEHCSDRSCKCDECAYWNPNRTIDDEYCGAKVNRDALELLKEQQERIAIMSEGGWHDAEKDQPKETDCYIVRIDYGVGQMTTMREYISSEGKWLSGIEEKITHWMPLPEPPKEGEQK